MQVSIMQVSKLLPLLTLFLASSLATAEDRNCSDLNNRQARQECAKQKSVRDVDCSSIDDSDARRECAQRKHRNGVDCSKLDDADSRRECARQKAE